MLSQNIQIVAVEERVIHLHQPLFFLCADYTLKQVQGDMYNEKVQPKRRMIALAAAGCKSLLGRICLSVQELPKGVRPPRQARVSGNGCGRQQLLKAPCDGKIGIEHVDDRSSPH